MGSNARPKGRRECFFVKTHLEVLPQVGLLQLYLLYVVVQVLAENPLVGVSCCTLDDVHPVDDFAHCRRFLDVGLYLFRPVHVLLQLRLEPDLLIPVGLI